MRVSPLQKVQQLAEASLAPYGPPEAGIMVAETFGELELEYAAIRKSCILLDQPHRAVLEISGKDRLDFLNRMVTQELKGLATSQSRPTFWLNRKGRIDADLRLIELGDRMLASLDALAAQRTLAGLSEYIISEEVTIKDLSEQTHRMALHGPTAVTLLQAVSSHVNGPPLAALNPESACSISIRGHHVVVDRDDLTGEIGLELIMPGAAALDVFHSLVETGQVHGDGEEPAALYRLRPAGWHAFNIARIEAGRPLYNIDFGPDSLPHETGIVRDRVSFKKGCYLGQEVVARMESRGHSKKVLMAVKCESVAGDEGLPRQPMTGASVWDAQSPESDPIGAVTSSTLAPMLSSAPVCFAMIKHDRAHPDLKVLVAADNSTIAGWTQKQLRFWARG